MELIINDELSTFIDIKVNKELTQQEIISVYTDILQHGVVLYEQVFNEETGQKVVIIDNSDGNTTLSEFWFVSSTIASNKEQKVNSLWIMPISKDDVQNEINYLASKNVKKVTSKINVCDIKCDLCDEEQEKEILN